MVIVCLLCGCGKTYECSRCDETTKEAYYDPFGTYEYLCEDCAKSYFSPAPYTNFKVD